MSLYYIKTYGCQMNKGDSARLAGILEAAGYAETDSEDKADLLLVNTCVVRQNAEDKAAWYIQSAKFHKKKRPNMIIGVCGCIVTTPGRNMAKDFPHVDVFIPPGQPEMLAEYLNVESGKRIAEHRKEHGLTAWIPIMEGCDNFCSYCIVPYTRGRERSRPVEEIIDEIKQLDKNQFKEIYLLGQNVNSYKHGLAHLLREIELLVVSCKLLVNRIRFMSSHPKDMSDEIINTVAELPHVCEYFHLPIQHGDDEILKKMNRLYTISDYKIIAEKIRNKMPDAAITSDIIVGFPGETEQQFKNSLKIIQEIGFDAVNTAIYSVRSGTAASKLDDDVPREVKERRLNEIMKVIDEVVLKRNINLVGSIQEILVDSIDPLRATQDVSQIATPTAKRFSGRTRTNKIVKFSSQESDLIRKLVSVEITAAKSWILEGKLLS